VSGISGEGHAPTVGVGRRRRAADALVGLPKEESMSTARNNLQHRLDDIQQLLDAHTALTRLQRIQSIINTISTGNVQQNNVQQVLGLLGGLSQVVNTIVQQQRGRPARADALNRSAIVLLSAHLQGYLQEVFEEAAILLFMGQLGAEVHLFVQESLKRFGNPQPDKIDSLFALLGIERITGQISWRNAQNKRVKERLRELVNLRNQIAHGNSVTVYRERVVRFMSFVDNFTERFDEELRGYLRARLGRNPW